MYVQCDIFLLADVFENFRNKCIEIYELDPAHFLSAPGLAWQACLKKTKVELELLTDIDMLLMVEKETRGGICQAIHRYAKANNKYMKNYNKDVMLSYLMYSDANNLSQKLPVNGFKWVKKASRFTEIFIRNYNENSDKGYFLQVDVDYSKKLFDLHKDLPFLLERKKLKGKGYSITERLTAMRMKKLTETRNSFGFTNVKTQEGRILCKEDNGIKGFF